MLRNAALSYGKPICLSAGQRYFSAIEFTAVFDFFFFIIYLIISTGKKYGHYSKKYFSQIK